MCRRAQYGVIDPRPRVKPKVSSVVSHGPSAPECLRVCVRAWVESVFNVGAERRGVNCFWYKLFYFSVPFVLVVLCLRSARACHGHHLRGLRGSDCDPAATNRELPRFEHRVSRGHAHVSGRGCFHCFCDDGSLLQVSCSTQKLLPVPQVSEQNEPGSLIHCSWLRFLSYSLLNLLFLSIRSYVIGLFN